MSNLICNYGQFQLTWSSWLIKDDSEILKNLNCDCGFEDCLLNWMVGIFYFNKLFKKKKLKQENAIYLYCQLNLWMSCIYMCIFFYFLSCLGLRDRIYVFAEIVVEKLVMETHDWLVLWLVLFSQKIHILLHNLISQAKISHFFFQSNVHWKVLP